MSVIDGIEDLAVEEWGQALSGVTGEQIRIGLDGWSSAWPPCAQEFRDACLDLDGLGIPDEITAWRLLCNARGKPGGYASRYQHPIVLAASRDDKCDVFAWSMLPEKQGVQKFKSIYQKYINAFSLGAVFEWPDEKAITNKMGKAVTPNEKLQSRSKALQAIKNMKRKMKPITATSWQRVHGMRVYT